MTIIVNLDVMLAKRKIRSKELAEAIGITEQNLSILKTGKAKAIRVSTLDAICNYLACQPGDILEYETLGYRDVHREHNGKKTHWIGIDFKVLVDRSKVKNGEPHKLDEVGWFTLDNLPEPLHSQFSTFLKLYKDKI